MATHSSILDWEIPWTEEPVSYSSWVLKRGGYNLVTKQQHKYKGKNTGPEVEIWVPVPTLL